MAPELTGGRVRPGLALPDGLTAREAEVLDLIAAGLSNSEMAQRLVVSPTMFKTHINRILAQAGVRDRAQAVRHAFDTGSAATPGSPC